MPNVTGSLTLNGITDPQLIKILQVKEKNQHFTFNPQQMQPVNGNENGKQVAFYNNAIVSWTGADGLKTVRDMLSDLLGG